MTFFVIVQLTIVGTALGFCVGGAVVHRLRLRRNRRREQAHRWAASVVLDAGADLDTAGQALAGLPESLLADVLQHLCSDTTGESQRRLHVVSQHAGLTHRIERMSRRMSWRRRIQAAHLLMLLPADAPERQLLLCDAHPQVRARAIESLAPAAAEEYADLLLGALAHHSPAVSAAAQHALVRGGVHCVPRIVEQLQRALDGELEPEVAVRLVEVAAELPDPALAAPLLEFVQHDDDRLRSLLAGCLGSGLFPDAGDFLALLLLDQNPDVRAEAARSVGAGVLYELAPGVGRLLSDAHWQVRREAGASLAQLGPIGKLVLRSHLDDVDPFARDMAMHMLGQLSGLDSGSVGAQRWVTA